MPNLHRINSHDSSTRTNRRRGLVPIAFLLAVLYTLANYRTTTYNHPSPRNNGIKYDNSQSSTSISTAEQQQQVQQQQNNLKMSDLYYDYSKDEYRAFIFAQHPIHGLLLLYCSRKKNKPPHFQAPGGHVDKEDFDVASARLQKEQHNDVNNSKSSSQQLLVLACKIGVARELYEETGIDIRHDLDSRLQPVQLRNEEKKKTKNGEDGDDGLACVHKHRLFFKICLTDDDFLTEGIDSKVGLGLTQSMNREPPMLMVSLDSVV
jgi:8-oxo-dGTP pyrophosphatase MutT (NUDIX family)